jgi:HD-GYP domain-containing protein (c-di-GMP phosphodiesterase class II)
VTAHDTHTTPRDVPPTNGRSNGAQVTPGTVLRLLCIDDRVEDAELEQLDLSRAGYALEATRVASEDELLAALEGGEFDLALLDYTLPGWDCREALAQLNAARPDMPVISVAGTIGEEAAVELLKLGAADYVSKDHLARLPYAVGRALEAAHDHRARREAEARLKEALGGTVAAMGALVEMRDPYTAGHEKRTAELVVAIGRRLGLDEDEIEVLDLTARMHDIGQIAVPAEILTRPGRLSENEFTLIKAHPQVAHDILATVDFGRPVAEVILQHHERLDGSGYPQGLKGDEILLGARVLAVADVVEAMSSHRPYRAALGVEAALAEVSAGAGKLYDARVVEVCRQVFDAGFTFEL